jgi:hypothetical protein
MLCVRVYVRAQMLSLSGTPYGGYIRFSKTENPNYFEFKVRNLVLAYLLLGELASCTISTCITSLKQLS